MSLYHECAQILDTALNAGGSLKSIIFSKKDWKTDRKTLFALSTEAAKWSEILSEVVERSEVLGSERTITPVLSLVLTHDLLLSKRGIALPAKHGLHTAIARHKARLASELTKARLRRSCPTLDDLRDRVNAGAGGAANESGYVHPRWIRINTLLTTLSQELNSTFEGYSTVSSLQTITSPGSSRDKRVYVDTHVPNLVAVPGGNDLSSSKAYKEGKLIFQERASCFPARLLDAEPIQGDVIDACAAPGNKTTHLAAVLNATDKTSAQKRKIFACEKDGMRSETLVKMVKLAGAGDVVRVKAKQDFLKLDPGAQEFTNVEALLLDPSCSGSGIVGRDEATVTIHVPSRDAQKSQAATRGKKRKRAPEIKLDATDDMDSTAEDEAQPTSIREDDDTKLASRLQNLSYFQLRLLQHAMTFPAANRITYSTCSLHKEENEHVVTRALCSDVARSRGWRVLRRQEQVEGMRIWEPRGSRDAVGEIVEDDGHVDEVDARTVAEACIRCEKGGGGGTIGFFVAGFVRDDEVVAVESGQNSYAGLIHDGRSNGDGDDGEGWEGFSDDENGHSNKG